MSRERMWHLEGAGNFRDLGGYRTVDGRETRWGRIFRSDTLSGITTQDLATLRSLDIRSVIDLRSPGEIAYTGRGLVEGSAITLIEVGALEDDSPTSGRKSHTSLDDAYWDYLTLGSAKFVRALQELGHSETYPVVLSCFFGKDRTGVLAALVLACVGVPTDAIVDDYVLTATRMPELLRRLQDDQVYRETLEQTPEWKLRASPLTMATFLARIENDFGSAESWALQAGVGENEIRNLRETFLAKS
jgi:protein-tyrosine phosphatase